jgi:hypothetical protein
MSAMVVVIHESGLSYIFYCILIVRLDQLRWVGSLSRGLRACHVSFQRPRELKLKQPSAARLFTPAITALKSSWAAAKTIGLPPHHPAKRDRLLFRAFRAVKKNEAL